MVYTLGEAAKATGKSKPAIAKAIAKGRISAAKDESGQWKIDPAELHRVYQPVSSPVGDSEHLVATGKEEVARLKATVEGLERLCRQIEGERDRAIEQNIRLTALLPPPQPAQAPAPAKRRWWSIGRR